MPNLNGMGPLGRGPATGRGMGQCRNSGSTQRCRGFAEPVQHETGEPHLPHLNAGNRSDSFVGRGRR